MKNEIETLLLFDSVQPEYRKGEFSRWIEYQRNKAYTGHTLITTFDIDYEFISKALNGLFFHKHACTILRSGFSRIPDRANIEDLYEINIYPYQKNKKTHAKALISVSDDSDDSEPQYFIAFGSANATYGGLGGSNLELIEAFSNFKKLKRLNPISKSIKKYLIETFLPAIANELVGTLPKQNIEKISTSLEKVIGKGDWPKIMDNQENSLISQMVNTKGRKCSHEDLHILSPYHGTTRNLFNGHFLEPKWIIGDDEKIVRESKNKYDFCRLKADGRKLHLHAKAYLIKKQKDYNIFYGSANCSENALCKTVSKNGGQLEILLSREIERSEYAGIIRQYMGEKAKFESYAKGSTFKEDEIDDSQLFCINIVTRKRLRFITLITAKPNIKNTIEITADQTNWVRINHALLNKEIDMDKKVMQKVASLFKTENLKWIYQKIGKDIFPVPINYEGALSYNTDVNSLEDEIIYYFSKKPPKNKKQKKREIIKAELRNYSSLTHESELDVWFKKIRTIKELEPSKEIVDKLREEYRDENHKCEFLKWYFEDNK